MAIADNILIFCGGALLESLCGVCFSPGLGCLSPSGVISNHLTHFFCVAFFCCV